MTLTYPKATSGGSGNREESGLRFARAITNTVDSELGKIKIPAMSSITLTSAKANIPLPVAERDRLQGEGDSAVQQQRACLSQRPEYKKWYSSRRRTCSRSRCASLKKVASAFLRASSRTGRSSGRSRCPCSPAASTFSRSPWSRDPGAHSRRLGNQDTHEEEGGASIRRGTSEGLEEKGTEA